MSAGIDELIARLQSKRFAIDEVAGLAEEAAAALERLRRELDEARKDAERYRLLRDQEKAGMTPWVARGNIETGISMWNGSALDAVIDEAIDAARQPQG